MTATQLIADLAGLGIRIEAHGDRLRYSPRSAVTPDLLARLAAHKGELLAILRRDRDRSTLDSPATSDAGRFRCPLCRSANLIDGSKGLWCGECSQLAWMADGTSITRVDYYPMSEFVPTVSPLTHDQRGTGPVIPLTPQAVRNEARGLFRTESQPDVS